MMTFFFSFSLMLVRQDDITRKSLKTLSHYLKIERLAKFTIGLDG